RSSDSEASRAPAVSERSRSSREDPRRLATTSAAAAAAARSPATSRITADEDIDVSVRSLPGQTMSDRPGDFVFGAEGAKLRRSPTRAGKQEARPPERG